MAQDVTLVHDGPTLTIDFRTPQGEQISTLFKWAPLGFTFDKQMPIIIDHVNAFSVAEDLGVHIDWEVTHVAGVELQGMEFVNAFHLLQDKCRKLKRRPKQAMGALNVGMPSVQGSMKSMGTSMRLFAEPAQCMIIMDWDDTIFPTSYFIDDWKLTLQDYDQELILNKEQQHDLEVWRDSLSKFLRQAISLSDYCVVVTSAQTGWVDTCIARLAPGLASLFGSGNKKIHVTYASEYLHGPSTEIAHTQSKFDAMKDEASKFYSRYKGQTWKNIVSLGDMQYEQQAAKHLALERAGTGRERLRTKTIVLPTHPSISEISLRLQFERIMLVVYVKFDGDFDVDTKNPPNGDPIAALAQAIELPALKELGFPLHAWGRADLPATDNEIDDAITSLHRLINGEMSLGGFHTYEAIHEHD